MLGTQTATTAADGTANVTVKVSKAAAKALKSLKGSLSTTVDATSGDRSTAASKFTRSDPQRRCRVAPAARHRPTRSLPDARHPFHHRSPNRRDRQCRRGRHRLRARRGPDGRPHQVQTGSTRISTVTVTFSQQIRSGSIKVTGPGGSTYSSGSGGRDPRNVKRLRVPLKSSERTGNYKASWTIKAVDGHAQRGSFTFKLK